MNIQTTKIKRLNGSTFQLPTDAGNIISVSYGDGTLMPPSYYTFIAPRLIKLGCPIDTSLFGCLNATYSEPEHSCGCNKGCQNKNDCGCNYGGCGGPKCN